MRIENQEVRLKVCSRGLKFDHMQKSYDSQAYESPQNSPQELCLWLLPQTVFCGESVAFHRNLITDRELKKVPNYKFYLFFEHL